jgi:hypothetical protein
MVGPTVANAAVDASGRACREGVRQHVELRGRREAPRMPATGAPVFFNGP